MGRMRGSARFPSEFWFPKNQTNEVFRRKKFGNEE